MPFTIAISVLYNWTRCPPAYHQPASDGSQSWAMLGILNQCHNCITFETCGILSPESARSFPGVSLFLQDKGKYRNVVRQLCKHTAQRWQRRHPWPLDGRPAALWASADEGAWVRCGEGGSLSFQCWYRSLAVWKSEAQKSRTACIYSCAALASIYIS